MKMDKQKDTKGKLLSAAIEVFAEKGYLAATIRDICALAGANVAAVNYHYGDKEKLYFAVLETIFMETVTCKDAESQNASPEEKLRTYLKQLMLEVYGDWRDPGEFGQLSSIFLMEMANPSDYLDKLIDKYVREDALLLESILKEILGDKADAKLLIQCANSICGMCMYEVLCRPINQRLYPDYSLFDDDIDTLTDYYTRMAMGGLEAIKKTLG